MFKKLLGLVVLILVNQAFAQEVVILDEKEVAQPFSKILPPKAQKSSEAKVRTETRSAPFFSERSKISDAFSGGEYESTLAMRSQRRVGVGFQVAGQMGLAGVLLELNIAAEDAALIGFGGGPKYNSFEFQWKHVFGGNSVSPYFTLGYTRWYNSNSSNQNISETSPSFLGNKFLSNQEKSTGIFAKDLLIPSLGLQFNSLRGKYAGTSIFAEIMMILNTEQLDQVPTGTMGMIYYF